MDEELKPIIDPDLPRRQRAFRIALAMSLVLVMGGWGYFFTQQIRSFVAAIPEAFDTPAVQDVFKSAKETGSNASDSFATDVKPTLEQAVQQVNAKAEESAATSQAVKDTAQQLQENP